MLMAVPSESRSGLELFRLALQLVEQDGARVEAPLADYVRTLVGQAKVLARSPKALASPILPEAIRLAVAIRNSNTLAEALDPIREIGDISPAVAAKLRESMEGKVEA